MRLRSVLIIGGMATIITAAMGWHTERMPVIKLAVCPTYYAIAAQLPSQYHIVHTSSTAESLRLLADARVAFVLAGRPPKPHEPAFTHTIVGDGFAIVAHEEQTITQEAFRQYPYVTDRDPRLVASVLGIPTMQRVDDIAQHLENVIAITDWEGAKRASAASVHVLTPEGTRMPFSRIPTLYCAQRCSDDVASTLRALLPIFPSSS